MADKLESYASAEPNLWVVHQVQAARALVRAARGVGNVATLHCELSTLVQQAQDASLLQSARELQQALQSLG